MPGKRGKEARGTRVVTSRWVENNAAAIGGISRYGVNRITKEVPRCLKAVQVLRVYSQLSNYTDISVKLPAFVVEIMESSG